MFTKIFTFLLFFTFSIAQAQDLLVTVKFDTLNCKIGKMTNDFYPITFVTEDEEMNGLIHRDSVFYLKKDVFRGLNDNRLRPWYPLVELGFDGGGAYKFGKFRMDDDLTDKSETSARTGLYIETDLTYYVSQRIGYGLKYNYRSLLEGDIRYQYFGPMIAFRFPEKTRPRHFFFNFSGGIGWMVQKNAPVQLMSLRPRIEMHAHSLSCNFDIGYAFKWSKHVSVRVKASCNIGYPGFVRIENLSDYVTASGIPLEIGDYCHNMNTVNITAGFLFHK